MKDLFKQVHEHKSGLGRLCEGLQSFAHLIFLTSKLFLGPRAQLVVKKRMNSSPKAGLVFQNMLAISKNSRYCKLDLPR